MARPERFERPTAWFVARYSIQLRALGRAHYTDMSGFSQQLIKTKRTTNGPFRVDGGERGIRTLDGLLAHTPLAGERLRPARPSLQCNRCKPNYARSRKNTKPRMSGFWGGKDTGGCCVGKEGKVISVTYPCASFCSFLMRS